MLRLAKEATNNRQAQQPSLARDDAQWFEHYGRHLGRLYEPTETLPSDLDQLGSAIVAKANRTENLNRSARPGPRVVAVQSNTSSRPATQGGNVSWQQSDAHPTTHHHRCRQRHRSSM
jgi:hypothetical protein